MSKLARYCTWVDIASITNTWDGYKGRKPALVSRLGWPREYISANTLKQISMTSYLHDVTTNAWRYDILRQKPNDEKIERRNIFYVINTFLGN